MKCSIKKGAENIIADVLSGRESGMIVGKEHAQSLMASTAMKPLWIEEMQASNEGDEQSQELLR